MCVCLFQSTHTHSLNKMFFLSWHNKKIIKIRGFFFLVFFVVLVKFLCLSLN